MNELIRPLEQIENEIKFYQGQMVLNAVELGKRLIEAKKSVNHGEWETWVNKNNFSTEKARQYMVVANEFKDVKTQSALGFRKLFLLTDVPAEERENFISEPHQVNGETKTVDEMTTRELQKAIKEKQDLENKLKDSLEFNKKAHELADVRGQERDEAVKTLEAAKRVAIEKSEEAKCLENALKVEKDKLKREKENSKIEIEKLQSFIGEAKVSGNDEEVVRLQASLQEIQSDLDSSAQKIDELEAQLKAKPIDVITAEPVIIEKVPEETLRELEELRDKAGQNNTQPVIKFKIYFEALQKTFRDELEVMAEIKEAYPEIHEKCKRNMLNLINSMSENL
jgi:hypothetical protein